MYGHRVDEDSQEITRVQSRHTEILELRAKRQKYGHTTYLIIAIIISAFAILAWGTILRDAYVEPAGQPSRCFNAFLSFAIVLGIFSAIATAVWMLTRVIQRLAAEQDHINEYDDEQQVKKTAAAVIASMREEERVRKQVEWARIAEQERQRHTATATGTDPEPRPVAYLPRARGHIRPTRF